MKKAIFNSIFLGLIFLSIFSLLLISILGSFQLSVGSRIFTVNRLNIFYVVLILAFISRELLNKGDRRAVARRNILIERFISDNFKICVFIATISLFMLFPFLNNYFYMDDFFFINRVRAANSLKGVFSLFISPFPFGIFYRPVILLFFLVNYKIFGLNPVGYNITNLSIHIVNLILFYFLVLKMTKSRISAFFSVFIYILNFDKYHLTVGWITGQTNLIASLFFLLSLYLFVIWQDSNKKSFYILSLLSCPVALLCKEDTIILPLVLIFYSLLKDKGAYNKSYILYLIKVFSPFMAIGCAYFILRFSVSARLPVLGTEVYKYCIGINIFNNFIVYLKKILIWSLIPFYLILPYISEAKRVFMDNSLRSIIFGIVFLIFSLLPVIALPHTTRQYFYLPTFGSSISLGILLSCIFTQFFKKDKYFAQVILMKMLILSLICLVPYAIIRSNGLKSKANITKDILYELKKRYAFLPKDSTIYFLDLNGVLESYVRNYLSYAVRAFYNEDTLGIRIINNRDEFILGEGNTFLFYVNGDFLKERQNLYQFYP